jgi:hypothetical protein
MLTSVLFGKSRLAVSTRGFIDAGICLAEAMFSVTVSTLS